MDWMKRIQNAIDYMEENIREDLAYERIAEQSFSSAYHFCRVFGILCGYTPGEYLRNRRLSLAGEEVAGTKERIIDIAVKYGYDSPDSFTKAFSKFHGATPTTIREGGLKPRIFSRLTLRISFVGGDIIAPETFRLEKRGALCVVGHQIQCEGAPSDDMYRRKRIRDFMKDGETRFIRYALQAMARDLNTEYGVITDITDEGYSFTVGSVIPRYFVEHLPKTVGEENAKKLTVVKVPEQVYAIAETQRGVRCFDEYFDLRGKLVTEQIPPEYGLACAPEVTVFRKNDESKEECYIEQWIPLEEKKHL